MHRRCAVLSALAGLLAYAGSSCIDIASARTVCESTGNSTTSAAIPPAAVVDHVHAGAIAHTSTVVAKKPLPHGANPDDAIAAGGGSGAPGDDDAAANLGPPVGTNTHRHGLRWQSMLPGVIK